MPEFDFDLAVVGAGLMGAATASSASNRGLNVVVLEQFGLGHARGSSHGSARIVRRAYADAMYVRMTGEALELWGELEFLSGTRLLRMVGGIDHGAHRDPEGLFRLLRGEGVECELLDAVQAADRWPGMRFAGPVLFHPEAGTVDAGAALAAFLMTASESYADIRFDVTVQRIGVEGDGVRLQTSEGELTARRVVVAAGAWVADLLGDLVPLPELVVTQQQIFHFPRGELAADAPIAVHKDALSVYSLPGGRDGAPLDARKIGEHDARSATTATSRDGIVDPAARTRIVEYVKQWLPGLVPEPFAATTCLYTSTANEDFVLDRVGPVIVCSPCSGHGAKFAPLIGRMATDLAMDRPVPYLRFGLAAHLAAAQ